jgi:hypothetical protein
LAPVDAVKFVTPPFAPLTPAEVALDPLEFDAPDADVLVVCALEFVTSAVNVALAPLPAGDGWLLPGALELFGFVAPPDERRAHPSPGFFP